MATAKEALKGDEKEVMDTARESLTKASMKMGEAIYAQGGDEEGEADSDTEPGEEPEEGEVIEGEEA